MSQLPKQLRFYTYAIPISLFAGIGYATSFKSLETIKTYGNNLLTNINKYHTSAPDVSYTGLIMSNRNMNNTIEQKRDEQTPRNIQDMESLTKK